MDDYWHGEVVVAFKPKWVILFSDHIQLIISFSLPCFAVMKMLLLCCVAFEVIYRMID